MTTSTLSIGIITLFPEMFDALNHSIPGRAQTKGLLKLSLWHLRDFAENEYGQVDDKPFGGGPGMVLMPGPLERAIQAAKQTLGEKSQVIYLTPSGTPLEQKALPSLAASSPLILIAGRYEGIDHRIIEHHVDACWSIGDYVLSGGELPAMVLIDSLSRLIPGVLGQTASFKQDSFQQNQHRLDHPHYTRPANFQGHTVPSILQSGNHAAIEKWRKQAALQATLTHRPDLIEKTPLTAEEKQILKN